MFTQEDGRCFDCGGGEERGHRVDCRAHPLNQQPSAAAAPDHKARRPMTAVERERARALVTACTFLPGGFDKRFCRDMARQAEYEDAQVTEKQGELLVVMCWRYRQQLAAGYGHLVPAVKPAGTFN